MAKKECTDIRDKFSDYIDELLSESEMANLEMHMKSCPSCVKELEAFNKTVQAVRNLPRYTAHTNIVVKINDRIKKNKRWWQRLNTKAFKGSLGTISAIIICLIGYQLYNGSNVTELLKPKKPSGLVEGAKQEIVKDQKAAGEKKRAAKEITEAQLTEQSKNLTAKKMEQSSKTEAAAVDRDAAGANREEAKKEKFQLKDEELRKAPQADKGKADGIFAGAASDRLEKNAAPAAPAPVNILSVTGAFEQKGLFCANSIKENVVIKDEASLKKLWQKSFSDLPEPAIDFKKEMLIVVFLGDQDTEPKDAAIKEITKEDNKITVKIGLTSILNTDTSGKKLSPYHIKAIRKSSLKVEFVEE